MNIKSSILMAGLAVGIAVPSLSIANPISGGNLVIYRVGNGSAALGTAATSVFLDEYTTAGGLVQSIAVSDTGAGAMTAIGNSSTEGILSLSQDGTKIVMTGYRANAGLASPNVSTINKVIGYVDVTGTVNTLNAITDGGTSAIRSATTVNGSNFYVSTAGAVRYMSTSGGPGTSTVIDARNSRQVQLYGNTLYASNGSTAITGKVQAYGILPTTTTAANPIVTTALANAVNGFIMLDMNAGVAGVDTCYALDTVANTILKWTYNGTTWSQTSSSTASGAANLIGLQNGSNVDLYMTTSTTLRKLTDSTGYGGILTGTSTVLATAAANTGFRGINSFNSVPEPASYVALGLGLAFALRKRK